MPAPSRRPILLAAVASLTVLATTAVGLYGLLRGPGQTSARASRAPVARATSDAGDSASGSGEAPLALPKTDEPVRYARAVAAAIFDWSTTSGYNLSDYTSPVLADADPSGQEVPGLIEDLAGYEPSSEQWSQLTRMRVVQALRIKSAAVPSLWPQALEQAHGRMRRGTTAVTITGVRHRTGVFYGQPETSSDSVSFTIFEVCTPAYPRCHTLRLSKLNDPLR